MRFFLVNTDTRGLLSVSVVIGAISVGNYYPRLALGLDWNADTGMFHRNWEFYQAGRKLEFIETEPTQDEACKYEMIEITLNEVFSGNLPRETINPIIFDEGDSNNQVL